MRRSPRSRSMDSSSDMGLTNRELQNELAQLQRPFIYEVRDEMGRRYRHCGRQRDADYHIMDKPGYTWTIVYLDPPPTVVDIFSERVDELQLPPQQILPENQQEPLDL